MPGVALRERMRRLDAPVGRIQPLLRANATAVLSPVSAAVSDTVSDAVADTATVAPPADGSLHAAVLSDLRTLDIRGRLVVDQALAEITPTAPASTSSVTIGFDYCLVHIQRPWWFDPFVTDPSWTLPGVAPGSLSAPGTTGGLPWLPIAVAVVRNLVVEAAWSGDDAANLAQATGFGPFRAELDRRRAGSRTPASRSPGGSCNGSRRSRHRPCPPIRPPAPHRRRAQPRTTSSRPGTPSAASPCTCWATPPAGPRSSSSTASPTPTSSHVGDHLSIPATH